MTTVKNKKFGVFTFFTLKSGEKSLVFQANFLSPPPASRPSATYSELCLSTSSVFIMITGLEGEWGFLAKHPALLLSSAWDKVSFPFPFTSCFVYYYYNFRSLYKSASFGPQIQIQKENACNIWEVCSRVLLQMVISENTFSNIFINFSGWQIRGDFQYG